MKLEQLDRRFSKIMEEYKQIISVSREMIIPRESSKNLITGIDSFLEDIKINRESEIENLYLKNLKERLNLIKTKTKDQLEGNSSFKHKLNELGLRKEDIEQIKEYMRPFNIQEKMEGYKKSQESLFWRNVDAESELKEAKKWAKKVLKIIYNKSPLKSSWDSFSDYIKTVNFSKGSDSLERYGKIQLGLRNFQIAQRFRSEEMEDYTDIFVIGRIVGEEGLFGHQGHFVNTKSSDLPRFMKSRFGQIKINAETIGHLGKLLTTNLIKQNKEMQEEFSPIFDLLKLEEKFLDYKGELRSFKNVIGDYLKRMKGYSIEEIQDYLHKITEDEYYKSDFFSGKIKAFYSSTYYQKIDKRIPKWYYLYSSYLANKIYKKMSKLDPEDKKRFIDHLTRGFWVKNTFEEYVDYLFKKFS